MILAWRLLWVAVALCAGYLLFDWISLAAGDECERIFARDRTALVLGLTLLIVAVAGVAFSTSNRMLASGRRQATYAIGTVVVLGVCVLLLASTSVDVPVLSKPEFLLGENIACGL